MKTLLLLIATLCLISGLPASAQQYATASTKDRGADQEFSAAELDQMLAPIALYPDALLSQVLMASTYPLEIVEAARWSRSHPDLEGEQAVEAVADVDWDPSVKGLVAFPDVLQKMDEDLDWTQSLGDAFLYQQDELMERVQFLRDRAYQAGNLESSEYARVVREERVIAIEPVRQHIVYVPYYDSRRAYGSWLHPAYPPSYWLPPPFYHAGHDGFFWSHGVGLQPGFFYSSMYWPQRHVVILHAPRYCHTWHRRPHHRDYYTAGQRWHHDPGHRRGVAYRRAGLRERATRATGRARPTLARKTEPPAIAPNQRARPPSVRPRAAPGNRPVVVRESPSVPRSQPRVAPDSGSGESQPVRSSRQRAVAAGNRSQDDTSSSGYRSPTTTLTRPH